MKYKYYYKTSDGVRHEASIDASCREAAFEALRKQGIKAIKVVAADGSKANGEVRGVRKRFVILITLAATIVASVVAFVAGEYGGSATTEIPGNCSLRHQIYGDPAIVSEFERGNFLGGLENEGDRLLAWFAQPGKLACPKNTSVEMFRRLPDQAVASLRSAIDKDIELLKDDSREMRELKQIVNGIHGEMRDYLANGNGTIRSYWRRLVQRTNQESQIYGRTRRELEHESDSTVFEQKNQSLRNLGLRTIPNPKDLE